MKTRLSTETKMPRTQSYCVLRGGPPLMKQFTSMIEDAQVLRPHGPHVATRQTHRKAQACRKIVTDHFAEHFAKENAAILAQDPRLKVRAVLCSDEVPNSTLLILMITVERPEPEILVSVPLTTNHEASFDSVLGSYSR